MGLFPLCPGRGKRLFAEGTPAAGLRLIHSTTTGAGVVIASSQAGQVRTGSYALDES